MSDKILLATRNQGKISELRRLLGAGQEIVGLEAFPQLEEVEETGVTFEENAALKAAYAAARSGLTALADDSGLQVEALDGAPGVRSARFYLEAPPGVLPGPPSCARDKDALNVAWLLERMKNVPAGRRRARFCCALVAARPDGERLAACGFWEGEIAFAPQGNNGFGYDPVFFDPELGLTAAQADLRLKNSRSHRAAALRDFLCLWPAFRARG